MTGTGTQTDPYIIENWADFFNITDSASYYKLGCNFDANDYNNGVWTACTLSCKELDGDYHEIRNINFQSQSSETGSAYPAAIEFYTNKQNNWVGYIRNITFENCKSTRGLLKIDNYNAVLELENVKLYAQSPYLFVTDSSSPINVRYSEISHSGDCFALGVGYYASNISLYNCNVYVDEANVNDGHVFYRSGLNVGFATRLYNSRIEGKVNFAQSTDKLTLQSSVVLLENTGSVTALTFAGDASNVSVVDSTIANCDISGTGVVNGTTEQLQNADWLNAAGFPVIAV